jgi:catechol 2,3-dioxygenase-like lactoylglutathione lyase family enzyme
MLQGIDHIVFRVDDVERTLAWYRDVFGLTTEGVEAWRAGDKPFASVRVGRELIIDLLPGQPDGSGVDHVAFVVTPEAFDAFVADHGELIEMGPASLSGARGSGDGVYIRDPDNHRLELRTYR